jgi:dihydrofolate reductase
MIIGIVAVARNFAIGKNGKLPWHHSADLKFFKESTVGHTVVMGANTWRSIGSPLPDRLNVVMSRSSDVNTPKGVIVAASRDAVLSLVRNTAEDLFIIGGASVYKAFADVIERWIVTDVPDEVPDADTFMPADFLDEFEEIQRKTLGGNLTVRILQRKKN